VVRTAEAAGAFTAARRTVLRAGAGSSATTAAGTCWTVAVAAGASAGNTIVGCWAGAGAGRLIAGASLTDAETA
jgi:hypothetical protein